MTAATPGRRPVVAIMGPTASGKTAVAMALAGRLDGEIISVDSAMVYRGMDIGTAKPTAEELARAPHRLIDVCDPSERYSAGRFRRDALAAIDEVHAAGRLPLLVGGTMLYFRALFRGLDALPDADPVLREQLDARAARLGWPRLHDELRAVDPEAAERIHPNDSQRIQRALEVHARSGTAISDWQRGGGEPFPHALLKIALVPSRRELLHRRIESRFRAMLHAGLLDEVLALHARGDLDPSMSALRAVGYRQLWAYCEGQSDLDEATRRAVTATRRLAKRQMTWLRTESDLHRFAPDEPGFEAKTLALVKSWAGNLR